MARPKLVKPEYPPIDWLMAAILERKKVMKLEWGDLGECCGMSSSAMRKMACSKAPEDWPKAIREKVCRKLGIEAKMVVSGSPGDRP